MKARSIAVTILFAFVALGISPSALGRSKTGEDAGHGFVINSKITRYEGRFEFTRRENASATRMRGVFAMNSQGQITSLLINDELVHGRPGDEPLDSLPGNVRGQTTEFSLTIYAYHDDLRVRSGHVYDDLLAKGEPILIIWHVEWQDRSFSYTPGEEVPTGNLRLSVDGEYTGSDTFYDPEQKGFTYPVEPSEDEWNYKVYDEATGFVYETGIIKYSEAPQKSAVHAINQGYEQYVQPFFIGRKSYFNGQGFKSTALRNGQEIPAAVYFGEAVGENLFIVTQGLAPGSVVEAKFVNAANALKSAGRQTIVVPEQGTEWQQSILQVPVTESRKFVVTVTGAIDLKWDGFYISFDSQYNGGGKGPPPKVVAEP